MAACHDAEAAEAVKKRLGVGLRDDELASRI
jgi:hypothetical protein